MTLEEGNFLFVHGERLGGVNGGGVGMALEHGVGLEKRKGVEGFEGGVLVSSEGVFKERARGVEGVDAAEGE